MSNVDKVDATPYYIRMVNLVEKSKADLERAHGEADEILCEVLMELGYQKLVDKYREVRKWYS